MGKPVSIMKTIKALRALLLKTARRGRLALRDLTGPDGELEFRACQPMTPYDLIRGPEPPKVIVLRNKVLKQRKITEFVKRA